MKKTIILLTLMIFYFSAYNQTNDFMQLKNWQLLGYAESAERISDSYTAIDYYCEYYKRNPKKNKPAYKLANLYFEVKNFKSAKPIYYDLYIGGKKKYSKSLFKYAQILKVEENYDSAVNCFEIYRDNLLIYEEKSMQDLYFLLTKVEIEGCEIADYNKDKKNAVMIHPLNNSINKAHKEYSPYIWNDTVLIYSSLVTDSIPVVKINRRTNLPSDKFYAAKYIDNNWQGGYTPPKPFFNLDSLSTSNGVFSDDNKRFYFTVSKKNIIGETVSAIYVSNYKNGEWEFPKKLDDRINLKNYISAQPSIGKCYNKDFDVIYFISDRPGGVGGFDIWYSIYDIPCNEYKYPVNAGSYINTPGNEITPFIYKSTKTLYFSSDGIAGYGGYDIYKTIGELVNWIPSKNIGVPFNSPFDDFYYTGAKNDSTGFLVSNRSESNILKNPHCCYDIFQYNILDERKIIASGIIYENEINYNKYFTKKGLIQKINKDTVKKISSNSIVKLFLENKNNGKYIFINSDTTQNDGNFKFEIEENQNYLITVFKENRIPTKIKFNTDEIKNKMFVLDPVTIIPIQKNSISINNIYFKFNKWLLTEDSKKYIDTTLLLIMKIHKDFVVEISAHTDGKGEENYNLNLSAKRVDNVVNYLTENGIERVRIISRGYGEQRPIAPEFTLTGKDYPEGRAKNRRIEFRVVGLLINDQNNNSNN